MQPQMPKVEEEPAKIYAQATTSRVWTPIDHQNDMYLDKLEERAKTGKIVDYEKDNKVCDYCVLVSFTLYKQNWC